MLLVASALVLTLCPEGPHDNCVWDGHTFWLAGEKIRIADIYAPELHCRCEAKTARAIEARDRLVALLNAGGKTLRRQIASA